MAFPRKWESKLLSHRELFMRWLKRIWLKIWKKIISVFFKKQMRIEQLLKKWFDDTCDHLEKHFQQDRQKTELEDTVNASISVVQNYLWSILKLLDKNQVDQHILPAMALLRCLYQLTSRITWILIGINNGERENRIKRLERDSLRNEMKLIEQTLEVYKNDERQNTRDALKKYEMAREAMAKRIELLKSCGTKELPHPIQILEKVFKEEYGVPNEGPGASELIPIAGWQRLHKAVHPDYLVLNFTIFNSEGGLSYNGDIKENIDDLKYECCVCVHRFLKEVYKFYKFKDFDKIDNDFKKLGNAIVLR